MAKTDHVSKDAGSDGWKVATAARRKGPLISTKSLLDATRRAVEQKDLHVLPSEGGWTVRREGENRAARVFGTKADAVDWATHSARKDGTDLVVHGRDGRVRSKNSYAADPSPPKDRKK